MAKKKTKALPGSVAEERIRELTFYLDCYLRASKRSLSHLVPRLTGEIDGSALTIGKVITLLETVERKMERLIDELRASASLREIKPF